MFSIRRSVEVESNNEITLQEIFSILWGKALWIILCAVLGGAIAFGFTKYMIPSQYTARVSMYVQNTERTPDTVVSSNDFSASERLIRTYVEVLKSDAVLNKVVESLELPYTTNQIRGMMSSSSVNGTEIFEIRVVSNNAEHSALIANTIAEVGPEEIIRVVKAGSVELIDPAKVPKAPSSPNVMMNSIIGVMLGGVLSVLAVLVYAMLDTRIKTEADLGKAYEIPVLGTIPCIAEDHKVNK